MPLRQVTGAPGIWRSDTPTGSPGTYAFVVGISKYDLLDGSYQHLGLNSLYVSALTAFRFFKYLKESYLFEGGPMFEATLLLSPTVEEWPLIAADPCGVNQQNTPRPTLQAMREALQLWRGRLAAMTPDAMAKSRLILFFSGHGLELSSDQQLLLPCDYPGPAITYNDAISTRNVWQGLGSLPIPTQLYFVDACRGDIPSLRGLSSSTGVLVFDEWKGGIKAAAPIFYASGSGEAAWQPTTATCTEDTSLYGKALLDALLVRDAAFRPDCSEAPCKISVFPLYNYVLRRVTDALQAHGVVQRPITLGGAVTDSVVSHWHAPPGSPAVLPPQVHAVMPAAAPKGPAPTHPPRFAVWRAIKDVAGFVNFRPPPFLQSAEIFHWQKGDGWIPSREALPEYTELANPDASLTYELRFRDAERWRWIQAQVATQEGERIYFGFLVPFSSRQNPIYAFDVLADSKGNISDIQFRLGDGNEPGPIADAARLWSAYSKASALGALTEIDRLATSEDKDTALAIRLLDYKVDSPLAATIAALALLRTDMAEQLRSWYENLALNVAESSDAAVFCLRSLVIRGEYNPDGAWKYLEKIAEFGTPVTTEACAYLMNFLSDSLEGSGALPFGPDFNEELLHSLPSIIPNFSMNASQILTGPFRKIASVLRTGGLFTTVASPDIDWIRSILQ